MKKNIGITLLRMLIGWHFLYEGLYKLVQAGGWSAEGYLRTSQWFAAPVFHTIAATPWLLKTVDLMNMWGLTLIGLALILGLLVRPAAFFGFVLLVFYFVAQPPFLAQSADGHFLWIDRNAVEAVALVTASALAVRFSRSHIRPCLRKKAYPNAPITGSELRLSSSSRLSGDAI